MGLWRKVKTNWHLAKAFRGDGAIAGQDYPKGEVHDATPWLYRPFATLQALKHKFGKALGRQDYRTLENGPGK